MRLLALLTIALCTLTSSTLAVPAPKGKGSGKSCQKEQKQHSASVKKHCGWPHTNKAARNLIEKSEGHVDHPYWDVKQWAIGYGHSCGDDKSCSKISQPLGEKKADKLLVKDLEVSAREKKSTRYLPTAKRTGA